MKLITFVCAVFLCLPSLAQEKFPDGTPVSDWFKDSKIVDINTLGKKYILTRLRRHQWQYPVTNRENTICQSSCRTKWWRSYRYSQRNLFKRSAVLQTQNTPASGGRSCVEGKWWYQQLPHHRHPHGRAKLEIFRGVGQCRQSGWLYVIWKRNYWW